MRFSFLLAIPIIAGAGLLEAWKVHQVGTHISAGVAGWGFAGAFVSSLAAMALLVALSRRVRISWFAVYLIPLGIAVILM